MQALYQLSYAPKGQRNHSSTPATLRVEEGGSDRARTGDFRQLWTVTCRFLYVRPVLPFPVAPEVTLGQR